MNILIEFYKFSLELFRNWFFFRKQENIITILGSARLSENTNAFEKAYQLSFQLVKKNYVIITGGGQGLMTAASKGAFDAGGKAIGCYVKYLESTNPYLSHSLAFNSLLSRQNAFIQYSNAFIFFPGGYGTLSELFTVLVMIQNTSKKIPTFLIGHSFWNPLIAFFKDTLLKAYQTIDIDDLNSIIVVDHIEEVLSHFSAIQISRP